MMDAHTGGNFKAMELNEVIVKADDQAGGTKPSSSNDDPDAEAPLSPSARGYLPPTMTSGQGPTLPPNSGSGGSELGFAARHVGSQPLMAFARKWGATFWCAVAGILAVVLLSRAEHEEAPFATPAPAPAGNCNSKSCVRAAAELIASMDTTAEPCENFYQYACGAWPAAHPIPSDKARFSSFSVLAERNKVVLKTALEAKIDALGSALVELSD